MPIGGGNSAGGVGAGGSPGAALLHSPADLLMRLPIAPSSSSTGVDINNCASPALGPKKTPGIGAANPMRRQNAATPAGPVAKKAKQGSLKDVSFVEASKYGSLNEFAFFDKVWIIGTAGQETRTGILARFME